MDPEELVKSATLSLNQWRIAQDKTFDNYLGFMTIVDGNEHWHLPPEGTIKVNTDATCFAESNTYAYAMVERDHTGSLLEAKTTSKHGHIDPMMAEALSIREALSWIKLKSWRKVIVETDCLAVVQVLRCSSIHLSYLGRIISECQGLLRIFIAMMLE